MDERDKFPEICPFETAMTRPKNDLLVAFQGHTIVLSSSACSTLDSILEQVSLQTRWPRRLLTIASESAASQLSSASCSYYSVRVVSGIRGGKGGFGTLLKGSARQAGAKQTTDFGACRDLQGRRLKHVNDQVAFQEWKQWNDKVEAGVATKEEMAKALIKSSAAASGVAGWYLQLPGWAEISQKKQQSQMWKQFYSWKRQQDAAKAAKEEAKQAIDRQIHEYVDRAEQLSMRASQNTQSALLEGLRASKRQRTDEEPPPEAMVTLSGDVVLARENDRWCMQSPSNFCSVGVLLEEGVTANLYYEACLRTGSLSQIGWAAPGFQPDSTAGDGVGDDALSWAFDPSRRIKLHGETSALYGPANFKAGDVVGCLYCRATGDVSFSLNGDDLGIAYHIEWGEHNGSLYPAISCNQGEIVELRLHAEEVDFCPENASPVGAFLASDPTDLLAKDPGIVPVTIDPCEPKEETLLDGVEESVDPSEKSATTSEVVDEPIDLDQFASIEELEALGLERLKGALMARGVKCGGSLHERAVRLLSLKGLARADYPKKLLAK